MNEKRLLEILEDLLLIHSPSRNEKALGDYVISFFERLGGEIYLDKSYDTYGGNCPTIFVKLKGNGKEGFSLSAHLDVVEPNRNLSIIKEDYLWRTDGNTTLGGDDKAGCAIMLYLAEHLVKNNPDFPTLYFIFTPGEEVGMLGARNIDWPEVYKHMKPSKNMVVLDNAGRAGNVAYKAPTSYHFTFKIKGRRAHAGIEPEKGINAIVLASKIISSIETGRIDSLTTSNISQISSDFPSNVVADSCSFSGELRAHDDDRAKYILNSYIDKAKEVAGENFEVSYECTYPNLDSLDDLVFAKSLAKVYEKLGTESTLQVIGGGSDANFFAKEGFNAAILGVGMYEVHTKEEYLKLHDLFTTTRCLLEYISQTA